MGENMKNVAGAHTNQGQDSLPLNLSMDQIEHAGQLLTGLLQDYERSVSERKVMPEVNRTVLAELLNEPFPEQGVGIDQLFHDISAKVIPNSTTISSPRFLAYVLGPPNGIAPFSEAIAAALNQQCAFSQLSPAASVIERKVVSWLGELFGYPTESGGIITSGGSMATLTALSAALHDKAPFDFRQKGLQALKKPLVLYTSAEAHKAIEKDAAILGLGTDNIRKIAVGADYRMRADLLRAAISEDKKAGRQPFCIVASAGTVNTGAIDPINDLADICAEENMWLHIDGAYGALFVLSKSRQEALLPCGRADSIALDPHKLLFAPLEAGCLVVRKRETLRRAFSIQSSYLNYEEDPLMVNYMDYGPQLSRGFKAFKVWCALQTFGTQAFVTAIDHMLAIAKYMEKRIAAEPSLELMAPVNLTAVCFRVRDLDADSHKQLLAEMIGDGIALLGPVSLDGQPGIRACITNYRTRKSDIDLLFDWLIAHQNGSRS
jgi:aromatic-L-amino-acid decarboxylase